MKIKYTKPQKVVIDFITQCGGKGFIVSGYRNSGQGFLKNTRTPALRVSAQCLQGMVFKKLILPVEGERHYYTLPL